MLADEELEMNWDMKNLAGFRTGEVFHVEGITR